MVSMSKWRAGETEQGEVEDEQNEVKWTETIKQDIL